MYGKFRPSAYPLMTVDPFFSVWSMNDRMPLDYTRHWTGRPSPILMTVFYGEEKYIICGFDENLVSNPASRQRLLQTNVSVSPLSTSYTFENKKLKVDVTFTSALLLDRPDIMSRPVSYIEYSIEDKLCSGKECGIVFGMSGEICVNDREQKVRFEKTTVSMRVGNTKQECFSACGEGILINWGYLHIYGTDAFATASRELAKYGKNEAKLDIEKEYHAYADKPYIAVERIGNKGHITVGYDEIKPIEYFSQPLDEPYKRQFDTFEEMLECADRQYGEIKKLCEEFEEDFYNKTIKLGEDYKNLLTLAYRQAIAAHKLVYDKNGQALFLSFECYSAGCIATLDVTYPSMPLFLLYNPELVLGMLRPIMEYAESDKWKFDFAPHDVGWYPIVKEQVYGQNLYRNQMPIEEIGNMMLCIAAVEHYGGRGKEFFDRHRETLEKWAEYLASFGFDPAEQLCTDDFGGHLNHNCNLSIKAILGLAAYSRLSGDESYMTLAKDFAGCWQKDSSNGIGTRLAFDMPDSWSMKYNMVWDNLLGFNLFDEEVKKREAELYKSKMNKYGVPLDNRADYAKCDWMMWTTMLYDDREYFEMVCESMARLVSETFDRVPFADWYCTKTAECYSFRNRTVVGGLFINLLK